LRLFTLDKGYFWDIDRFRFFTESEKCAISDALKLVLRTTEKVDAFNIKGGMNEMMKNMIDEVDKSLK